jgi:heat shock protein HslJ
MAFFRSFLPGLLAATLLAPACQTTPPPASSSPAAASSTPPAALRNTRWVLRRLGRQPIPTAATQEPYLLLRANELKAEGNGSCNRFAGSFELPAPGQLRFGPLLSTRMACADPAGTATETGFLRALDATRTYQISGDTLRLFGDGNPGAPAAVLHAVYLR